MPPLTYENLRATAGLRLTAAYQWDGEEDGSSVPTPVDLSSWEGTLQVRDRATAALVLEASTVNGMMILGADGSITVDIPGAMLPPATWYPYGLLLWTNELRPVEFATGRLDVRPSQVVLVPVTGNLVAVDSGGPYFDPAVVGTFGISIDATGPYLDAASTHGVQTDGTGPFTDAV